ncbi:hypothetical protein JHK84_027419 [Glycine max]|uniref:Protein kinase domain-containing protein n=1 Tax=Glycine max TaxID=3847 RepID=K7LHX0_SOYBN|nr:hypothetical protein JHK86_027308 [Glycine max]KAG5150947.1 hypothetical protein JHK84_027419 [Glycine max]KAH1137183.1 hypothetical protein GYH30_027243 [Glycine max]
MLKKQIKALYAQREVAITQARPLGQSLSVISSSFFSLQCRSMRMLKVLYSSAEATLRRWASAFSGFSSMSSFLRIWSRISFSFLTMSFFCSWRFMPARKPRLKRRWASWGICLGGLCRSRRRAWDWMSGYTCLLRMLDHTNVLRLKHCFYSTTEKDDLYLNLVLEYVPETVYRVSKHYVRMHQHMPIINMQMYTYQICRGLNYLHHVIGVCLRDIKPQNLLVNPHTH